jgi:hypothetical protein
MDTRRAATLRDLPAICLICGAFFAVSAVGLPLGTKLDMAKRSELHALSGIVLETSKKGVLHTILFVQLRGHPQ